jgi:hypothetical protein
MAERGRHTTRLARATARARHGRVGVRHDRLGQAARSAERHLERDSFRLIRSAANASIHSDPNVTLAWMRHNRRVVAAPSTTKSGQGLLRSACGALQLACASSVASINSASSTTRNVLLKLSAARVQRCSMIAHDAVPLDTTPARVLLRISRPGVCQRGHRVRSASRIAAGSSRVA